MNRITISLLFSLFTLPVFAANHALVVGVSKYPGLGAHFQLRGPRNDATLVAQFLGNNPYRSFENLKILADGVKGAEVPTRAAILTALDDIAQQATRDEFVYLHFSGHGSRAPAKHPETETDGLDELFLPADVGQWDDAVGEVENALVDDEIGERIAAIRNKGAFVWAVFDSCHSGTVTRGAPVGEDLRERRVGESALGIPADALIHAEGPDSAMMRGMLPRDALINRPEHDAELMMRGMPKDILINHDSILDEARMRGLPTSGDSTKKPPASNKGGFVAFYAAQTTETTPEMRLPRGEEGRVPHGLFTFTLFRVIAEHPGISYRQAAQEVLRRYAASYMNNPTPLFEGDLDQAVFGIAASNTLPQWPVSLAQGTVSIAAGRLHGLGKGTRLALLPGPTAKSEEALAWLEVRDAENLSSELRIQGLEGKTAPSLDDDMARGAYARLLTRPISFELSLAKPLLPADLPAAKADQVRALVEGMKPDDDSGLRLKWIAPGEPADIRMAWSKKTDALAEQLWLLPPTGELIETGPRKTPSITFTGKSDAEIRGLLADSLARIARVKNLLRLGEAVGSVAALDAALRIKRAGKGPLQDQDPATIPRVHPGDEVHLIARNPGKQPLDLNVLFIGSDYSISHMYKERIHPGGTLKAGLLRVTADSLGNERVLVIATPAKQMTEVQDLAFLEQTALPRTRAHNNSLAALLGEAGFGQTTRGAAPLGGADDGPVSSILQFPMLTLPVANQEP